MRGGGGLNRLVRSLGTFCRKYPFQRKALIAPSYWAGNELLESLARHTGGFMNLCAETVEGLARKAAAGVIDRNGLSLLSSSQAAIVFENVYRQLDESGALVYFSRKGASGSLVRAIAAAILELRSFGITGESIDTGSFVSPEKGRDIKKLLCAYERYVQGKYYIDYPGLLKIAMEQHAASSAASSAVSSAASSAAPEDAFYLMPPFLHLNPLEREFITRKIPAERLFVLQAEPIPGLAPPPGTPARLWPAKLIDCEPVDGMKDEGATAATDVERLTWLLQPEHQPERASAAKDDGMDDSMDGGTGGGTDGDSYGTDGDPYGTDGDPYGTDGDPDDGTLILFHAYGATNEAREALRRITAMQIPLDTVTVAYTGSEYVPVFHSLCRRAGIEMTVSEGIPASLTWPGKALKGIVEWIRSDFAASVLRQLLIEDTISLRPDRGGPDKGDPARGEPDREDPEKGDKVLPPLETAELLRASGIGWGRERYASVLAAYRTRISDVLAGMSEDDPMYASLRNRMELAAQLSAAIENILEQVPEPDASGSVDFGAFASAMASLLSSLARAGNEIDKQTLDAIISYLGAIGWLASFSLGFEDALDRMAEIAGKLRVGASPPRPGALHLVHYSDLHWTCRPHTFVVGLDADSFPGGVAQDPVLLDSERQLLHPELPLGRDRPRLQQYGMLTALCSRPCPQAGTRRVLGGRVSLSYPSFDVVENRDNLPSSLLLQAFRLLKKNPSLDYSKLQLWLGSPAGYCRAPELRPEVSTRRVPWCDSGQALDNNPGHVLDEIPGPALDGIPGQAIDETEWWLEQVLVGRLANGPALVRQCYRNIEGGQAALTARQAGVPTEYDGMVPAAGEKFARRRNLNHLTLSCSRIEHLASCPFAYFLRYVLYLEPPAEVTYDPGRWLDPAERGLLLHELYCKFMKEIARRGQRVTAAAHRNMMYEMANELIERYRIATPPPGEVVFKREAREILDSCDIFLAAEESGGASAPVFFEVPFGMPETPGKMFGMPETPGKTFGMPGERMSGGRFGIVGKAFGILGEAPGSCEAPGSGAKPGSDGSDMAAAGPIRIDLGPGVSFSLRGQIDRIDRVGRDVYRIWDYKTGSARGYEEHRCLCKGRQVQHALYAIAAEQILRERLGGAPRVLESGYYFPTKRGEGRRVVRPESDLRPIAGLMGHLFDILSSGAFLATDDGEACAYCDYAEVCDQERAVPRAKALVADPANSCLDPWRRLKKFE